MPLEIRDNQQFSVSFDASTGNPDNSQRFFKTLKNKGFISTGGSSQVILAESNTQDVIIKIRKPELPIDHDVEKKLKLIEEHYKSNHNTPLSQRLLLSIPEGLPKQSGLIPANRSLEVFSYIPGNKVSDYTEPKRFNEVCASMQNVFEQLRFITQNPDALGSYHGDISIYQLIDHEGIYVLLDFANHLSSNKDPFAHPVYKAPEIVEPNDSKNPSDNRFYYDESAAPDDIVSKRYRLDTHLADVYSLGATLARTLLGDEAFESCIYRPTPNEASINRNHIAEELLKKGVPKEAALYIRKMLNPDQPRKRIAHNISSLAEDYDVIMRIFAPTT